MSFACQVRYQYSLRDSKSKYYFVLTDNAENSHFSVKRFL